jgi:hypothetical protein
MTGGAADGPRDGEKVCFVVRGVNVGPATLA